LNLKVREISSDNQLDAVAKEYLDQGEIVFAYLRKDLDPDTYGVLIRLEKFTAKGFAWVAIVDCRGRKAQRRFFTLWHEIAHCLTAVNQYELPLKRTRIGNKPQDAIETL